jgi:two-component system, LytTR family, response regulator
MRDKIRVLVVDDEPLARRGIRQLLETETDFEIVGECKNGREAAASLEKLAPELIFLDVQMPLVDGFSFIEKIGAENLPEIVFVTAFDEHAIHAFETGAIDYLLKPVDPLRFQKTLERARERIKNSKPRELEQKLSDLLENLKLPEAEKYLERIAIKKAERIVFVRADEIVWISSEGNYVKLHTARETHLLRETMDKIEQKLNPDKFLRLRRSVIASIEQIKELHPLFGGEFEVVLNGGIKLSSSRRYRKNLDALLKS